MHVVSRSMYMYTHTYMGEIDVVSSYTHTNACWAVRIADQAYLHGAPYPAIPTVCSKPGAILFNI